jgi:hypothetical protein
MLEKLTPKLTRPDPDGEEVVQTIGRPPAQPEDMDRIGEPPSSAAKARQRALTSHLMEQVCEPANLNRAHARVMSTRLWSAWTAGSSASIRAPSYRFSRVGVPTGCGGLATI